MPRATQFAILLSILGIAARLIWIDQPYIDNWSWRQSDVAAIARNYFTGGFHFARPQIDWAGDQPGYVGTEFPILPFIAALCYKFFGVHEWIGRAQAVILFAVSAFAYVRPFYRSRAPTALRDLGLELKRATPPNALIVVADNGDPTAFYYAERKGWHFLEQDGVFLGDPLDSSQAIVGLEKLRHHGARYLVFTWATRWWLDYYKEFTQHLQAHSTLVKETPEFTIYRLDSPTE